MPHHSLHKGYRGHCDLGYRGGKGRGRVRGWLDTGSSYKRTLPADPLVVGVGRFSRIGGENWVGPQVKCITHIPSPLTNGHDPNTPIEAGWEGIPLYSVLTPYHFT